MIKYYRIAGLEFELHLPDEKCYTKERNLAPFAVEKVDHPHRFYFETVPVLAPPAGIPLGSDKAVQVYADGDSVIRYIGAFSGELTNAHIRETARGHDHAVQMNAMIYPERYDVRSVLKAMDIVSLISGTGGVVLHASYIDYKGKAIIFTAPSGTGKSTQAELWRRHCGAEVMNGDRCGLLVRDGAVCAEGVPFSGTSGICKQRSIPVAAIVYLSQAPETSIHLLKGYQAFRRIWEGCTIHTWNPTELENAADTVSKIAASVPVYYLACTPDEAAVRALRGQLQLEEPE